MNVNNSSIVTTPGASEPQGSAVVGGSGVKAGSKVAGPLRSLSSDREGAGVASQAPTSFNVTSAEATVTPYTLLRTLGGRIQNMNGALSLLFTKAQALETMLDKLRSDQAKLAIHEVLSVVKTLRGSKEEMARAYNAAAVKTKEIELNPAVDQQRTATIDAETQSPCWWDIGGDREPRNQATNNKLMRGGESGEPTDQQAQTRWTEVVRKKKKKKEVPAKTVDEPPATRPKTEIPKGRSKKRVRTRPPAIRVDAANSNDYPALVKRIKDGMDGSIVGNNITGIKQAKNGGLLLEVRGDVAAVEALRAEVARSAGTDASVRLLQQKTMLEIRDIDAWTCKEDIAKSIERETAVAKSNINVVSLRASYGGTQTALVLLPTNQARTIVDKGRLKVSVVSCRVRQAERSARCFRCMGHGHEYKSCQGVDRSADCRRCGKPGHKAKDCVAEAEEAMAFRSLLAKESQEAHSQLK